MSNGLKNEGCPPFFGNAEVMQLDTSDVLVTDRIGFYHEDKAAALGRLMAVDGQRDPIKVVRRKPTKTKPQNWALVVGRHRLGGAEIESNPVWALEVNGKPEDLTDLEASENLHRRPLGPIERAKFTAALVQAAQERIARQHGELSQHKLASKARWDRVKLGEERAEEALTQESEDTCDKMAHVYGWEQSVGDALELGRRTIHRDLTLYRMLIEPFPELIEDLSRHPVVGENATQLGRIANVKDEELRRLTIEALLADAAIGADEARIAAGVDQVLAGATIVPYQKHYDAISGGWSRLGKSERRRYLPQFTQLLTDGEKTELRLLIGPEPSA